MSEELGPIDTNVRLPKGVLKDAEIAEAIHKAAYQPQDDPAPAPDNTAQPPPAPEPPQPAITAPEPPAPPAEDWEHKFKSMQGRYNRAQDDLRRMSAELATLQAAVNELKTARERTPEPLPERLITPQEEQDYGSEFLTVVGKKAKEEFSSVERDLRAQIAGLEARLAGIGTTVVKDAREKMLEHLDSALPKWKEINLDEKFLDWLQLPDAFSGAIRHDLLKQAYEQNNAPRVLAFFKGYIADEAATAPGNRREPAQNTGAKPGKVPLESLAAPGRASTAAGNTPPAEKPIISTRDITKFYADLANGVYRGREAEKDRYEAMIFEAQREGRIVQ